MKKKITEMRGDVTVKLTLDNIRKKIKKPLHKISMSLKRSRYIIYLYITKNAKKYVILHRVYIKVSSYILLNKILKFFSIKFLNSSRSSPLADSPRPRSTT